MNTVNSTRTLRIKLYSYWLHGTGGGRRGGEDRMALRDPRTGLPVLTRKALRGLLREAVQLAEDFGHIAPKEAVQLAEDFGHIAPKPAEMLFGRQDPENNATTAGILGLDDAVAELHGLSQEEKDELFEIISSTAIQESGIADDKTLRSAEVALPLELTANIRVLGRTASAEPSNSETPDPFKILETSLPLLRKLGSMRHRGLGRCKVSLDKTTGKEPQPKNSVSLAAAVKKDTVWLRIEVLSPAIFTANGATVGGHVSLDYIPGSTLMGVVASDFQKFGAEALLSSAVRFGDGLPLTDSGEIGWPVPFSYHRFKAEEDGATLNGTKFDHEKIQQWIKEEKQLQQMRSGYVTVSGKHFIVPMEFMQGSAINRDKFDRPRDGQFFGYGRIPAGMVYAAPISFSPEIDHEKRELILRRLIEGEARIGRSRANYGQLRIAPVREEDRGKLGLLENSGSNTEANFVYAVSDLLMHRDGQQVFRPVGEQFGLDPEWVFDETRSFVRTRSYSPWNRFFNCPEPERQVIIRGSVLAFKKGTAPASSTTDNACGHTGLGYWRLNPPLLLSPASPLSQAEPMSLAIQSTASPGANEAVASLLAERASRRKNASKALGLGRSWAKDWFAKYNKFDRRTIKTKLPTKSQWSNLREIAVKSRPDKDETLDTLLEDLRGYCNDASRRKRWNDQSPAKLYGDIHKKIKAVSEFTLAAAALAEAAVQMRRNLSQLNED